MVLNDASHDAPRPGGPWADFEQRVAIREYLGLLEAQLDGIPAQKAAAWRRVMADAPARSRGSVEYRFQNISHVLASLGYPWVRGYPPASNTGHELPPIIDDELRRRPEFDARLKAVSKSQESQSPGASNASPGDAGHVEADPLSPRSPHVSALLGWHAHSEGGVSVPFRDRGQPLGRTIGTTLMANLAKASTAIAAGEPGPRWIFLVGGPGNGKSHMVEEFGRFLDAAFPGSGLLKSLEDAFAVDPVPRRVEVALAGSAGPLPARRLAIIQDASASDTVGGNAADLLVSDLDLMLADPESTGTVFVCSANRGLLARAVRKSAAGSPTHKLLVEVFRWTGLGEEALLNPTRPTWPLGLEGVPDGLLGAWPLDAESLLVGSPSAFDQLVHEASLEEHWEESACQVCPSSTLCPFLANARSLRQDNGTRGLRTVLRRAELASSQRWNFRLAFSLVAELVVGDGSDFGDAGGHPCDWVHARRDLAPEDTARGVSAVAELASHLFPHALFAAGESGPEPSSETTGDATVAAEVLASLWKANRERSARTATPVRQALSDRVSRTVDPAAWSPSERDDPFRKVEDAFARGVRDGSRAWSDVSIPTAVEVRLLEHLARAEDDAELAYAKTGRVGAQQAVAVLRVIACELAKRSAGVRLGVTDQNDLLQDYEAIIHDQGEITRLRSTLRAIIGRDKFAINALAGFGSMESSGSRAILKAEAMQLGAPLAAPSPSPARAAHDVPVALVQLEPPPHERFKPIPLTFPLFRALRLAEARAADASLPASVLASLEVLTQAHANRASRDEAKFRAEDNEYEIVSVGGKPIARLVLPPVGGDTLQPEAPTDG